MPTYWPVKLFWMVEAGERGVLPYFAAALVYQSLLVFLLPACTEEVPPPRVVEVVDEARGLGASIFYTLVGMDTRRAMRRLADQGRTIVLITHATKNVMLADKVAFLARGGYLARRHIKSIGIKVIDLKR